MTRLLPELAQWNNGKGIAPEDWICAIGRYDHALAYALLFWPEFVLHDDCLFLEAPAPERYREWMKCCHGNKSAVEAMANHRHIADLFPNSEFEADESILVVLGRLLQEMWSCKLRREFPQRPVQVEFASNGSGGLLQYEITVFQPRG